MGLFSTDPNEYLGEAMEQLEKYEAETGNEVTVVIEEGDLKSGETKIQCPNCRKPRLMDLEATTDSCSCEYEVTFPD